MDTLADQLLGCAGPRGCRPCSGLRKGRCPGPRGLSAHSSEQGRLIQVRVGGLCLLRIWAGVGGGCHHLLALLSACCPQRPHPGPGLCIPVCGQADEAQKVQESHPRSHSSCSHHCSDLGVSVVSMAGSSPSISQIHPSSQIQAWRASQAHLCQWTQETQDVASIRLIEVQGHVVLSGKHPHPQLCHVVRELYPSARSPHPLPFDAHSLPGKGVPTEELSRPLVCPQHLLPTPAPTRAQPGRSQHQAVWVKGFLTLTTLAAPARIFPLVESGFRISSLGLCRFPEEN